MGPVATAEPSPKEALQPPPRVRGMTALDRDAFKVSAAVPYVEVPVPSIGSLMMSIRDCLLKMRDVKPIAESSSSGGGGIRLLLLDPRRFSSAAELDDRAKQALGTAGVDVAVHCGTTSVQLSYDSWSAEEILRAVLPAGAAVPSSFSIIGHVAHVNLKDQLLPYKHLIGQVLLDKNKCLKTVVNKVDTIDNTFRNFAMEVLAGEPSTDVTVKENGCVYQFDFAKVYWNPRLSTEHERIIAAIDRLDVVYDVFAGVGPFSVPAAKKRCTVLANDLNGESYKHLCSNFVLNKVKGNCSTFNLDGRAFISTVVKADMALRLATASAAAEPEASAEERSLPQMHVIMNLPALAADFLDAFPGLLGESCDCDKRQPNPAEGNAWARSGAAAGDAAACAVDAGGSAPSAATSAGGAGTCGADLPTGAAAETASADAAAAAAAAHDTSAESRAAAQPSDSGTAVQQPSSRDHIASGDCSATQRHTCAAAGHLSQRAPLVHCYSFGKGEDEAVVRAQVAERMNAALQRQVVSPAQVRHVRNVAPNKDMFCATFPLPADVLLRRSPRLLAESTLAAGGEPSTAAAVLPSICSTLAVVDAGPPAHPSVADDATRDARVGTLGGEPAAPAATVPTAGGSSDANETTGRAESGSADLAIGSDDSEQQQCSALAAPGLRPRSLSATDAAAADPVCSRKQHGLLAVDSCGSGGGGGDGLLRPSVSAEATPSDPPPKRVKLCD